MVLDSRCTNQWYVFLNRASFLIIHVLPKVLWEFPSSLKIHSKIVHRCYVWHFHWFNWWLVSVMSTHQLSAQQDFVLGSRNEAEPRTNPNYRYMDLFQTSKLCHDPDFCRSKTFSEKCQAQLLTEKMVCDCFSDNNVCSLLKGAKDWEDGFIVGCWSSEWKASKQKFIPAYRKYHHSTNRV